MLSRLTKTTASHECRFVRVPEAIPNNIPYDATTHQPPRSFAHNDFHRRSPGTPRRFRFRKNQQLTFTPPPRKCYMNHEIHCLIDPESSQEKEAYDLEINWRIDEYRKKHGKNDTTLEGFQGAFPCRPSVSPLKRGYRVFLKGSKRGGYNF